jgi:hypothetical protein
VGSTVATATAITERKSELDLQRRADVRRWEGYLGSPPTTPVNFYATATDREDFSSPTPAEQIPALRVKVTPSETHEASVLAMPLVGAKLEFVFGCAMQGSNEATARLQPRREDQYGTPRTGDAIYAYGGENFGLDGQLESTRGPPLQGRDDSFEPLPLGAVAEGAMTLTEDEIQFIIDALLPIVLLGQGRNLYDTPGNIFYREEVRARRQEHKDNSDKRVVPLDIIKQFRFAIKVSEQVQYLYVTTEKELVRKVQGDLRTRKRRTRSS